jgi:hypothetical protein
MKGSESHMKSMAGAAGPVPAGGIVALCMLTPAPAQARRQPVLVSARHPGLAGR